MQVIPAIDIMDGKVVRLEKGRRETAKAYFDDPVAVARAFAQEGAQMAHVVGLDAAFSGRLDSLELIKRIAQVAKIQYGGGIRSASDAEKLFAVGVSRIVLGTATIANPGLGRVLCARYPGRIVAALDISRPGKAGLSGWISEANLPASLDGFSAVLVTDISKDGMLSGSNTELVKWALGKYGISVIASGGVSSLEDISSLGSAGADAIVIGRALYERRFSLSQAIEVAENVG
ncbi:MAG: 1-(5-phosphoribosyl)-5-[(5-phosphoribosylamino)methylideneamino] imidazole-4-carboxamide isomerase [Candidatus Micrarchaeota archaeon]